MAITVVLAHRARTSVEGFWWLFGGGRGLVVVLNSEFFVVCWESGCERLRGVCNAHAEGIPRIGQLARYRRAGNKKEFRNPTVWDPEQGKEAQNASCIHDA